MHWERFGLKENRGEMPVALVTCLVQRAAKDDGKPRKRVWRRCINMNPRSDHQENHGISQCVRTAGKKIYSVDVRKTKVYRIQK